MRKISILLLVLFIGTVMIGCNEITSSTISTTTTTTITSTSTTTTEPNEISFTGFQYVEGIISWDIIPDVKYDVYVNNSLVLENATSYDTTLLASEMIYKIQVHASLGELVSDSGIMLINRMQTAPEAELLTLDLSVNRDEAVYASEVEASLVLNADFVEVPYTYSEGEYLLSASYLASLGYGDHVFYFVFEDSVHALLLTIIDTRTPSLIGTNQIAVDAGSDVVVEFSLYNGSFVSLSGNDITTEDYSIVSGILTIDGSYIQNKFVNEPGRTTLILSYTLQAADSIIIGYLFITLND
ncbi:MAG: hypothetical protein AB7U79_08510 [Candidatus Izemoplasmatales bacterium]